MKKVRSPNYPAVNLATAVRRAGELYNGAQRHAVGIETVARLWGFSPKSSNFKVLLAAMRAFGLIEDQPSGQEQLVKLSSQGLDIVTDYPEGSPERQKAIEQAALRPKLHAELWKRYGGTLPVDHEIRRHLVKERGFHDKTVGDFIAEYKETLSFAKLAGDAKMVVEPPASGGEANPPGEVEVGAYVQWTNAGGNQFTEPRLVQGLSEDRQWAFVEGCETGVPVSELTVMTPKSDTKPPPAAPHPPAPVPPSNPFAAAPKPPAGSVEERTNLEEGLIVLQWPSKLSAESIADVEYWFKGLIRRTRRKAGLPPDSNDND